MGRGLSKLQKDILKIAYRNRDRRREHGTDDVTNREVLIEVYKFPFHSPSADTPSGSLQIFERAEIGINRYNAATASVVKAFNRLVKRGFATRECNHGIVLTNEGTNKAEVLSLG